MCVCVYILLPASDSVVYATLLLILCRSDISDSSTIPAVDEIGDVGDTIGDDSPVGFHICDSTQATNKDAILTLAAPCKLWAGKNDWYGDQILQIRFGPVPSKTPIISRLKRYEEKAKKILQGRHRNLPEFLNKVLFMSILEGELLNQSVRDLFKQGRIHDSISCVQVDRGSDAV